MNAAQYLANLPSIFDLDMVAGYAGVCEEPLTAEERLSTWEPAGVLWTDWQIARKLGEGELDAVCETVCG